MLFYNDLFKKSREHKCLTLEEIGKRIGVSKQTVHKWESGKIKPRPANVYALAKVLGISAVDISDLRPEKWLTDRPEEIDGGNSNVRPPSDKGCFVPIITSAAAATCNPGMMPLLDCVNENSEDHTWFKDAKQGDFVIEVIGDSMLPWYPEGTLLLVRPYQDLTNGKRVVAVLDDGSIVFKVYAAKDDKVCLYSIGADGKDYIFDKNNVRIRYICTVIASQRNESDLDLAMSRQGITHSWQTKLEEL